MFQLLLLLFAMESSSSAEDSAGAGQDYYNLSSIPVLYQTIFQRWKGVGLRLLRSSIPPNADIVLAGSEMAGSRYQKYRMTE